MAPKTLDAPAAQANGKTNGAPSDVTPDPIAVALGDGENAPISDAEAAVLRGEEPPVEDDTQPTAESDESGEEVDGEESAESEGDKPEGDEADLDDGGEVWKQALQLANGDPKKALKIAAAALGVEGEEKNAAEPAGEETIAKAVESECDAAVAKFYEERGTEEKPGDERKALSRLLAAREVALVQKVGALLDQFEGNLKTKSKVTEATKALWKEHPGWKKDEVAFKKFATDPAYRSLPPLDAYELFLVKKAKRAAPVAAKKDAATQAAMDRKARGTAAQAAPGGRPSGPVVKQNLTTEQREIRFLRENPGRIPRLP